MDFHRTRCLLTLLCDPYSFPSPFLVLVSAPSARAAAGCAVAAPSVVLPGGRAPRRWEPLLLAGSVAASLPRFLPPICLLDAGGRPTAKQQEVKDKSVAG